jgi:spermidine synthase
VTSIPTSPIRTEHALVEIRADGSPGGRLVLMDGVEASHVDLGDPTRLEFEYLRHISGLLDAARAPGTPLGALQVGGGPCTLARWLTATRPGARMTVVERDRALIDLARDWLGLRPSPRLHLVVGDGRTEIRRRTGGSLDLVVIDAFVGRVVPYHLVTAEFLDEVRRVLRPGGLHVVNLIDDPPLGFAAAIASTLLARFASVLLLADERVLTHRSPGNLVLAASDEPLPVETIARRASRDRTPWEVRSGRALRRFAGDAPVLSDAASEEELLAVLGPLGDRAQGAGGHGPQDSQPRRRK